MTDFDSVIPPGREGKVKVSIDTAAFRGPISKAVTVTTNDPARSSFALVVRADVVPPIEVQPAGTLELRARAGERQAVSVTVSASDGASFDVTRATTPPCLELSIAPVVDGAVGSFEAVARAQAEPQRDSGAEAPAAPVARGASSYRLLIETGPDCRVGRTWPTIGLVTTHAKEPSFAIPVQLAVHGDVEVEPERVFLRTTASTPTAGQSPGDRPRAVVRLTKPTGEPLRLESITSASREIAVHAKPIQPGREYHLEVTYVGPPRRASLSAQIEVRTNVPRQREIVIPVITGG